MKIGVLGANTGSFATPGGAATLTRAAEATGIESLWTAEHVLWPDEWTAATLDGKPTAQFEHTLLITETGVEELTGKIETSPKYAWE